MNAPKKRPKIRFKREKIIAFVVVIVMGYSFFTISKAIFKNHLISKDLDNLSLKVARTREQNLALKDKIEYYKTSIYKEREARARLDLKLPGEKVLIIVDPSNRNNSQTLEEERKANRSNPQKWLDLFFRLDK